MTKLIDVVRNRPGGIYHFEPGFDLYEGETLDIQLRMVEYVGGPFIDCSGWSITDAGIALDPYRPQPDINLTFGTSVDANGLMKISSINAFSGEDLNELEDNIAGSSTTYPHGRPGWIYVRAHQSDTTPSYSAYLIKPSQIFLRQGPGAPN